MIRLFDFGFGSDFLRFGADCVVFDFNGRGFGVDFDEDFFCEGFSASFAFNLASFGIGFGGIVEFDKLLGGQAVFIEERNGGGFADFARVNEEVILAVIPTLFPNQLARRRVMNFEVFGSGFVSGFKSFAGVDFDGVVRLFDFGFDSDFLRFGADCAFFNGVLFSLFAEDFLNGFTAFFVGGFVSVAESFFGGFVSCASFFIGGFGFVDFCLIFVVLIGTPVVPEFVFGFCKSFFREFHLVFGNVAVELGNSYVAVIFAGEGFLRFGDVGLKFFFSFFGGFFFVLVFIVAVEFGFDFVNFIFFFGGDFDFFFGVLKFGFSFEDFHCLTVEYGGAFAGLAFAELLNGGLGVEKSENREVFGQESVIAVLVYEFDFLVFRVRVDSHFGGFGDSHFVSADCHVQASVRDFGFDCHFNFLLKMSVG